MDYVWFRGKKKSKMKEGELKLLLDDAYYIMLSSIMEYITKN